jgi:hypothetical protein
MKLDAIHHDGGTPVTRLPAALMAQLDMDRLAPGPRLSLEADLAQRRSRMQQMLVIAAMAAGAILAVAGVVLLTVI